MDHARKERRNSLTNKRISPRPQGCCGLPAAPYVRTGTLLESSSSAVDEQAALEKMGVAMVAALQGVRSFSGAGSLCVDDLFSGVQFVIDVEIVRQAVTRDHQRVPRGQFQGRTDLDPHIFRADHVRDDVPVFMVHGLFRIQHARLDGITDRRVGHGLQLDPSLVARDQD